MLDVTAFGVRPVFQPLLAARYRARAGAYAERGRASGARVSASLLDSAVPAEHARGLSPRVLDRGSCVRVKLLEVGLGCWLIPKDLAC